MSTKISERFSVVAEYSKGIKKFFALALLFSMTATVLNTISPQIIKITVDSVIGGGEYDLPEYLSFISEHLSANTLTTNLILMAISVVSVYILSGSVTFLSRLTTAKASETFIKRLKDKLFLYTQKLPLEFHVKNQTGDIIQRCTSDTEVIRNFITNQFLEVFRTIFLIGFAMVIMFSMNVKLSWIALSFVPIVILYSAIFYSIIARRFKIADEAEGALSSVVQENLTGVRVVRAFGRQKFEMDKFVEKNDEFANLWINLGKATGYYWGIGDLITGLQIATVILFGVVEAVNGNLTTGEFLAFVTYNQSLIWPIRGLGRILSEMSKAGISFDRVNYILNTPTEKNSDNAKTVSMNSDIEFKNVKFSYLEGERVLNDVSFKIKAGETFAILGSTGSGKSTLMHLLDRLYDLPKDSGEILIDGVNIKDIKREWIRKNIGIVLQEPFLFSRTIAQNINAVNMDATIEETRAAASIACVDESIIGFADGYDTIVGERGVTLSGGQKQRVAISRMLMQKAPIMVFDDSLSAVDSQTDSKIRAALKEKLNGATVIIISHRITTLMQADKIMVLDNGKVAQMGTHEQLLNEDGIYKDIYDIQMHKDIVE